MSEDVVRSLNVNRPVPARQVVWGARFKGFSYPICHVIL